MIISHLPPSPNNPTLPPPSFAVLVALEFADTNFEDAAEYISVTLLVESVVIFIVRTNVPPRVWVPNISRSRP